MQQFLYPQFQQKGPFVSYHKPVEEERGEERKILLNLCVASPVYVLNSYTVIDHDLVKMFLLTLQSGSQHVVLICTTTDAVQSTSKYAQLILCGLVAYPFAMTFP